MKRLIIAAGFALCTTSALAQPIADGLYCTTIAPFSDVIEWRITREGCCPGVYSLRGREVGENKPVSGTMVRRFARLQIGFTIFPRGGERPLIGSADVGFSGVRPTSGPGIFYLASGSGFGQFTMKFVGPVASGSVCR